MSVEVRALDVRFGDVTAVSNFSATFHQGTISALSGGDGAGKSTLLKVLAGRVLPISGSCIGVPGKRNIGYQPADGGVWNNLSVLENLQFVAGVYGMSKTAANQRIEILLKSAGLDQVPNRLAGNLSGGMRQKLGFIMATLHRPQLLLLDEPTTGVDPASREELWELMVGEAQHGTMVVFATTYIDEAERASQLFLMNDGRTIAAGSSEKIIEALPGTLWQAPAQQERHTATEQVLSAPNTAVETQRNLQSWRRGETVFLWKPEGDSSSVDGFSPSAADIENASIVLLLADERARLNDVRTNRLAHFANNHFRAEQHTAFCSPNTKHHITPKPVEVTGVKKDFGGFTALSDVTLAVKQGEIVGLIGGNGAGKTTLMRVLLGLETASHGQVLLFGKQPSPSARQRIGYVPQGLGLYPTLSARENLQFACQVFRCNPSDEALKFVRQFGSKPVHAIPLGARRLLAYVVATEHNPELLVLDEPTSGVDPVSRMRLWEQLHEAADSGISVLITTHYMSEAAQCDRCIMLAQGRVVAEGTLPELTANHHSIVVDGRQWEDASVELRRFGMPVCHDGRNLRVIDGDEAQIRAVLSNSFPELSVHREAVTLEEILALFSR